MDRTREAADSGGRFRCDPDASLRPFVVEYWAIARDLAALGGFTITPDCFGELICCVDDLHAVGEGGREKLPTCFLVPLLPGPLRIEADGVVRCMAARLRPWAVGRLLSGLADGPGPGWRDAAKIFGADLAEVAGLVARGHWPRLAPIFDRALIDEVGRWSPGETGGDLIGPILGGGPRPTVKVAAVADTSTRQVERRVRRLTGTSPKQLAGLARFQRVRDAIWADPAVDLSRMAIEAGYADQPHMTREFRRFAGLTPARFAREAARKKRWLAAQDVAIVQEPEEAGG